MFSKRFKEDREARSKRAAQRVLGYQPFSKKSREEQTYNLYGKSKEEMADNAKLRLLEGEDARSAATAVFRSSASQPSFRNRRRSKELGDPHISPMRPYPKRFFKGGGQLDTAKTAMLKPEPPTLGPSKSAKNLLDHGPFKPAREPGFVRTRRKSKEVTSSDLFVSTGVKPLESPASALPPTAVGVNPYAAPPKHKANLFRSESPEKWQGNNFQAMFTSKDKHKQVSGDLHALALGDEFSPKKFDVARDRDKKRELGPEFIATFASGSSVPALHSPIRSPKHSAFSPLARTGSRAVRTRV